MESYRGYRLQPSPPSQCLMSREPSHVQNRGHDSTIEKSFAPFITWMARSCQAPTRAPESERSTWMRLWLIIGPITPAHLTAPPLWSANRVKSRTDTGCTHAGRSPQIIEPIRVLISGTAIYEI